MAGSLLTILTPGLATTTGGLLPTEMGLIPLHFFNELREGPKKKGKELEGQWNLTGKTKIEKFVRFDLQVFGYRTQSRDNIPWMC